MCSKWFSKEYGEALELEHGRVASSELGVLTAPNMRPLASILHVGTNIHEQPPLQTLLTPAAFG